MSTEAYHVCVCLCMHVEAVPAAAAPAGSMYWVEWQHHRQHHQLRLLEILPVSAFVHSYSSYGTFHRKLLSQV